MKKQIKPTVLWNEYILDSVLFDDTTLKKLKDYQDDEEIQRQSNELGKFLTENFDFSFIITGEDVIFKSHKFYLKNNWFANKNVEDSILVNLKCINQYTKENVTYYIIMVYVDLITQMDLINKKPENINK